MNKNLEMLVIRSKMLKFRTCPKCGGNLYTDSDRYGKFDQCLQCGYIKEYAQTLRETKYDKKYSYENRT